MNNFQEYFISAKEYYHSAILDLIHKAYSVSKANHNPANIQKCSILSIKTGGCSEDCKYCSQSSHYKTNINNHNILSIEEIVSQARQAKANGADRFCMGLAWRQVKKGKDFATLINIIKAVKTENIEACITAGMIFDIKQAQELRAAGLDFYNHNIDTSRDYYQKVVTTHSFDDRINTLKVIREAGIKICCGGIIGMGESRLDRCAMLAELASFDPQPESVPINLFMPIKGTPFENITPIDNLELIRTIAVARILIPKTRIKLSAGRANLSKEMQIMAFYAGVNAIFLCDKLLTERNSLKNDDYKLLADLLPLC